MGKDTGAVQSDKSFDCVIYYYYTDILRVDISENGGGVNRSPRVKTKGTMKE